MSTKEVYCSNLKWCHNTTGPTFFRFEIELPAFFILSEPLSRFQAYKQYAVPISSEHHFYSNLGLIPVYFANLNRISCINFWGRQASDFFAPYSQPLQGDKEVMWQFGASIDNSAQFSSLNFVLWNGAEKTEIPATIKPMLSDYFKYAFWSFPKPGFCCSAHIIYSRETINHILKVAKSIYLVKHIHPPQMQRLTFDYSAWVQRVELTTLTHRGESQPFSVFMAKDVVNKIETQSDHPNNENFLVNGVIYEFKNKNQDSSEKTRLLSVIADFLPSDVELFKTLICQWVVEKFYYYRDSVGLVGSIDELQSGVGDKYRPFLRRIEYATSFFDTLGSPIEYIIGELYPLIIEDAKFIFFVHPLILSAIASLSKTVYLKKKNKLIIINFISLLEKCKTKMDFETLRFTDEAEYFKRLDVDFHLLKKVLLITLKGIEISKLMNEYY